MTIDKDKTHINAIIPLTHREELEKIAEIEGRESLSKQVAWAIKCYLEDYKKKNPGKLE